ncbi:MAG: TetR/AcrR family transcriptional regulator [Bdellovibrionales bacterium]|nr:TetR/AcrR family transcriptional regulator [Bdellovibrionales bacterium]
MEKIMKKGDLTRQNILSRAVDLASQLGLEGLSIGLLANTLNLSKSGLFAHFQSKEALQIQVLDAGALIFSEMVVRPAIQEPRGEPRIRAIFEKWIQWVQSKSNAGGCLFVAASAELDDRAGPVRDHLVKIQKDWLNTRVRVAMTGVEKGFFRSDLDCEQFAFEEHGIMLAYHHTARLLRDPKAEVRARQAFERLIQASQPPRSV